MGLGILQCLWTVPTGAGPLGRPRKPYAGWGGVWIETEGRKQDLVVFLLSDGKATEWASLSEGCSTLLRMQLVQQGCRFGHAECGYRWDSMG